MIFPISHENQEVNRLPWVTFAIILICVTAHIFISRSMSVIHVRGREAATQMMRYLAEHPYLELSPEFVDALEISDSDLEKLREMLPDVPPPEDPRVQDEEQQRLDELIGKILSLRESVPYRRWGLSPNKISFPGLITHIFIHGGWLHLMGNLLFLYLTGPFVEDLWGRWIFLIFYLLIGILSGLMFCAHYPHITGPLIGASGAIAGVMGAFLLHFWKTRIRFAYFFAFFLTGTFKAPAWLMLPLWMAMELLNAGTMDQITGGKGGGTAHWAHVWGFVFGFLFALILKWSRFVERRIQPTLEAATRLSDTGLEWYEEGLNLIDKGKWKEAQHSLVKASRAHPGDPDIIDTLQMVTRHTGDPSPYIERASGLIEARLRTAERSSSVGLFFHLCDEYSLARLPHRTAALMVPELLESGNMKDAKAILEHLLEQCGPDTPVGILLPLVEGARQIGGSIRERAIDLVRNRPDIPQSLREQLPLGDGETPHVSQPSARMRDLRVTPAVPLRLGEERILLRLGNGKEGNIELHQIRAVGVSAIPGEQRPVIFLIDLFMDDPEPDLGQLRLLRLASNHFNPGNLVRGHVSPASAFTALVHSLLERAQAAPWPDAHILNIRSIPRYPDQEALNRFLMNGT